MGCGSCGSNSGTPGGCKSHGYCATGGCNRMNVYNWLSNLPYSDNESACKVVEISFNHGSRKHFFRNTGNLILEKGDMVAVEGVNGFDVGMVNLTGELVRLQLKKSNLDEKDPEMKKVLRKAQDTDISKMKESKAKEAAMLIRSRAIARQLRLNMKMAEVEIQADGKKATYFYIADERVDFRELIKIYAAEFKVRVEMRQIGARQEAGKVGGIGSCGRELCCSSWLTDFKSVNTNAARYQNLSINQTKLSGQCGRLKCCLNFELDTYLDALQSFPNDVDHLETAKGRALLVKKDIFRNLLWYVLPESNKQYPLSIEMAKKIRAQNREGVKPEFLESVEVVSGKPKEVEPEYADLVGQISLKSLERTTRKRRDKERNQQTRNQPQQGRRQGPPPQQRGPAPKEREQGRPSQPPRQQDRPTQAQDRPAQERPPQDRGQQQRQPPRGGQQGRPPRRRQP